MYQNGVNQIVGYHSFFDEREESLVTNFVRDHLKAFFTFIMCIYVNGRTCYAAEYNTIRILF